MDIHSRTHDLLSGAEVVDEFPFLSLRHLRSLRTAGLVPYYPIKHATYYSRSDIEAYVTSCRAVGPQARYRRRSVES